MDEEAVYIDQLFKTDGLQSGIEYDPRVSSERAESFLKVIGSLKNQVVGSSPLAKMWADDFEKYLPLAISDLTFPKHSISS